MSRISKLTEEQWAQVCAYYEAGHTLVECQVLCGVCSQSISRQLKRRGTKVRAGLEPSNPRKAARIKNPVARAKYAPPQVTVPLGIEATPEGGVILKKRKIIETGAPGCKSTLKYEGGI